MQETKRPISNEKRTAMTKAALMRAARVLFVEKGYAETGTPELVKAAGVTRGALYHHFEDKLALFRALVEEEGAAVAAAIDGAVGQPRSAIDALKRGARAYFKAMRTPGRTRLLLIDAPSALGLEAMRKIDDATSGGTLRAGLQAGVNSGELKPLPTGALNSILNAAFDRAALDIAAGAAEKDVLMAIDTLVDGLKA
jgi:AcrR family transcriptional regulator